MAWRIKNFPLETENFHFEYDRMNSILAVAVAVQYIGIGLKTLLFHFHALSHQQNRNRVPGYPAKQSVDTNPGKGRSDYSDRITHQAWLQILHNISFLSPSSHPFGLLFYCLFKLKHAWNRIQWVRHVKDSCKNLTIHRIQFENVHV